MHYIQILGSIKTPWFFEVVLLRVYFWYTKIKGVVHVLFYLFVILDPWDFGILQSLDFGVFFSGGAFNDFSST